MKRDHIVIGGKKGEQAHCRNCGQGLELNLPQSVNVFTGALKGFMNDHANCKPGWTEPIPKTPAEWYAGRDTGRSSMTIYRVMIGAKYVHDACMPHDADDFGRCYRLLKIFPDWRPRLPEVAAVVPDWKPIVEAWGELTAIYEAELASGRCQHFFKRLQEIVGATS